MEIEVDADFYSLEQLLDDDGLRRVLASRIKLAWPASASRTRTLTISGPLCIAGDHFQTFQMGKLWSPAVQSRETD
jgi:hypothetical protein